MMWGMGEMDRSARCFGGRQQIPAALAILGLVYVTAGAQIIVNETALHGGESVYGRYVPMTPIPFQNWEAITLLAWGETDPNLYADVSFYAYGLYSEQAPLNFGAIDVNAVGGNAYASDSSAVNAGVSAYGIYTPPWATSNGGDIRIMVAGGTADANALNALANAKGIAYGVYTTNHLIANGGRIDVEASGGTALSGATGLMDTASASGQAYGLYAESGDIENHGPIAVTARGGYALAVGDANAAATAYGAFTASGSANNSGDMTVTAISGTADAGGQAYTIANAIGLFVNGDVENTGNLAIAAVGGVATTNGSDYVGYAHAYGYATGIWAQGVVNNSGNITATAAGGTADASGSTAQHIGAFADARISGIFVHSDVNNSGSMTITAIGGTATSTADAVAHGIYIAETLNNSGNVVVTATGGTAARAMVQAFGLEGYNLANTGVVTIVATGGTGTTDATSYAEGVAGSSVNNTGAISVTATGGTTGPYGLNHSADALAVGIAGDPVYNSGTITVTAKAPERSASTAYGIRAGGNVSNSGAITVTATVPERSASTAYGIRMDSNGILTNTGIIRVTGDTAYELYVASNTTSLVDTYNVTLDGDPSRASLGIADGATLALNNARLTVTAVSGQTRWGTPYKLFETQGTGAVDGKFAGAQAANPNTTVTYYDQGTTGSADDTVALAYTPGASPTLAAAAVEKQALFQAADVVNRHMTAILLQNILNPPASGLLADAGSTAQSLALAEAASDKTSGVFVEPYYSRLDKDADPLGYDARLWGFSAGCERYIENTIVGLYLGYGRSDIDYTGRGYGGNREDQDVVTGGFCALTRWDPWTLRYGLTGFYGWHDYEGLTGLSLDQRETASYDSYGTVATLLAGHISRQGPHVFLPEAGLAWLWTHRPGYTTEATDPVWDTTYGALDDHDVQAVATLTWLSSFLWHNIRVSPSVSVGIRQLLTDAETSVRQSVDGAAPVLVESEQDRTAFLLSGSLVLTKTPHAISLAYDGDYSPDAQRQSIWLRYSWLF